MGSYIKMSDIKLGDWLKEKYGNKLTDDDITMILIFVGAALSEYHSKIDEQLDEMEGK